MPGWWLELHKVGGASGHGSTGTTERLVADGLTAAIAAERHFPSIALLRDRRHIAYGRSSNPG
jgi:hypothetical protein